MAKRIPPDSDWKPDRRSIFIIEDKELLIKADE